MTFRRVLPLFLFCLLPIGAQAAAAQLSGRVTGENGKPLAADVYLYAATPKQAVRTICEWCCRECTRQAKTDAKGQFVLREVDPALRYRLLAVAKGHDPAFADTNPNEPVTFKLRARAGASPERVVRGKVVDGAGKPVLGAMVEAVAVRRKGIRANEMSGVEPMAISDASGEFALGVRESLSRVDVRVRGRNFAPILAPELATNMPHTITVGPGVTVSGRLLREGKPLAGIRIGYAHEAPNEIESLGSGEIGTDAEGRFVFTSLAPNAQYEVFAKMDSLKPLVSPQVMVRTGTSDQPTDAGTLEAVPGFRVAGKVSGVIGKVPEGTILRLIRGADVQSVPVSPDGSFAFEGVPSERLRLLVRVSGYRPKRVPFQATGDVTDMVVNIGQ